MNEKEATDLKVLTLRIQAGDSSALGPVFELLRPRLRAAIRSRVNRRIRRREDESDILQEAYFAAANDFSRYAAAPRVPVYIWLRELVQQRMIDAHRKHLACQKRAIGREVSLHRSHSPAADASSTYSIANEIVDDLTSPSLQASKAELRTILQKVLEQLEPIDQEIILLRHMQGLKSSEVAALLQINQSTASTRYLRALTKPKEGLSKACQSVAFTNEVGITELDCEQRNT